MTFKRKAINFNLDCPHQRELYEFCMKRSSNFSGFVKDVLFLYKQGTIEAQPAVYQKPTTSNDVELAKTFLG